jgi:SAM-dependent methyltransferase
MPPMPPAEMRFKVAAEADETHFDVSGRRSVADLTRALAGVGRPLSEFKRMLEWGCGCGRILRQLEPAPGQEVYGCDIDPEMIEWLQGAMPELKLAANDGLPPLSYSDGQFDLIFNHSVLSHLDEAYQDAWLAELARVLAHGGVLILTVQGAYALEVWTNALPTGDPAVEHAIWTARQALAERGIYFLRDDAWAGMFPAYYQSTFHTVPYVFDHWSKWFDILSYIPRGSLNHQDMVVMTTRRERPAPRPGAPLSFAAKVQKKLRLG